MLQQTNRLLCSLRQHIMFTKYDKNNIWRQTEYMVVDTFQNNGSWNQCTTTNECRYWFTSELLLCSLCNYYSFHRSDLFFLKNKEHHITSVTEVLGGRPTSKRWNLALVDGAFLAGRNDLPALNRDPSSLEFCTSRCRR